MLKILFRYLDAEGLLLENVTASTIDGFLEKRDLEVAVVRPLPEMLPFSATSSVMPKTKGGANIISARSYVLPDATRWSLSRHLSLGIRFARCLTIKTLKVAEAYGIMQSCNFFQSMAYEAVRSPI